MSEQKMVTVSFEVAELIDHVYLPVNVNKIRSANPSVIEAVKAFKAAVERAKAQAVKE